MGDVVLYERKVRIIPQRRQPIRHAANVVVVDGDLNRLLRIGLLVPMQRSLNEVVAEEPGPARNQELLSGHLGKLFA